VQEAIMSVESLSKQLNDRYHGKKLKVRESADSIIILPIKETSAPESKLFGMLKGKGVSTENFMARKQEEKGLDL